MAGASLIRRETTMSAVSISRPVVFSDRPYSSRIQSARLVLSQGRDLTTNRSYVSDEVFPDIQSLSISHASGSTRAAETNQALSKESAFPNFRLLQRLAASAKARISSNSLSSQVIQPSQEDELSMWNSFILHSTEDLTNDFANITLPSRNEPLLPPANAMTEVNGNCKVHRSKSRKRQSKFKTKKLGKQPSHTKRYGGKTTISHLQPTTSKVFPTFSQRYTKQRKSNSQPQDKRTSNISQFSSGSVALQFSLAAYPEYQSIKSSNSDLQNALSKGDLRQHGSNAIQEAKLRAIYDTPEGASVSATSDTLNRVRLKKVFQSEKQSGYITQCGRLLPCAPPTSPTPLLLDKYEIIPSLADLRSQQSIKQRLNALEKENKKKRQAEDQEKKRKERQILQTQFEAQRVRTRQEIYALNKIMTKLEKEHFKRFQEKMENR